MRQNTLLVTVTLIALFVISLVVGYFAGERFFKPQPSARPGETATRPETVPPTVPPPPTRLRTPSVSTPAAAPLTPPPATPVPVTRPPTSTPTPQGTPRAAATREAVPEQQEVLYRVQVGAFARRENAEERAAALRRDGFDPATVLDRGLYKVRVGAFRERARAVQLAQQLRARGYDAIVVP